MNKLTIGQFIRQCRLQKNMTLGDFKKLNFDKTLLSKIENGRTIPKAENLKKIAMILEINVVELYKAAGYLTDDDVISYAEKIKETQ